MAKEVKKTKITPKKAKNYSEKTKLKKQVGELELKLWQKGTILQGIIDGNAKTISDLEKYTLKKINQYKKRLVLALGLDVILISIIIYILLY